MKYGILSTASIAGRFIAGVRESGLDEVCAIASRSSQKPKTLRPEKTSRQPTVIISSYLKMKIWILFIYRLSTSTITVMAARH